MIDLDQKVKTGKDIYAGEELHWGVYGGVSGNYVRTRPCSRWRGCDTSALFPAEQLTRSKWVAHSPATIITIQCVVIGNVNRRDVLLPFSS